MIFEAVTNKVVNVKKKTLLFPSVFALCIAYNGNYSGKKGFDEYHGITNVTFIRDSDDYICISRCDVYYNMHESL